MNAIIAAPLCQLRIILIFRFSCFQEKKRCLFNYYILFKPVLNALPGTWRLYQLYLNLLSSLLIFTVSPDSVSANLDTMVVTDSRSVKNISTTFQQQRFGLSDDISKLLYLQPGVDRLPETGSAMLVRGCGLYDNLFTIAGVPMLNPVHFGLHSSRTAPEQSSSIEISRHRWSR